jgi:NAD(P)-dependent dehydrogenase (short-subunit alcohol dehydrogenase family)
MQLSGASPNGEPMATDNVVLVTGASTGFGRLISITLARHGYVVYASMRDIGRRNRENAAELEDLGRKQGLRLRIIELDVTVDSSVQRAVEHLVREVGRIDIVVNNAGVACWGVLESFVPEQAKEVFETNFFGPLRVNRAVLPHMRKRRSGLLIHISSVGGRLVLPSMGLYCATKFALEAMAETQRYELSQLGIDSVVVERGAYPTAIVENAVEAVDKVRTADYDVVMEASRNLMQGIANADTDTQDVADRVTQLIEMAPGSRPLRSLVGRNVERFHPINDVTYEWQTVAMQQFGLGYLMTLRAARQVANG